MEYREQWADRILGQRSLLECALDVRMTASGAGERSQEAQNEDVRVLRDAIQCWKPSLCDRYKRFDDAVYELINAALDEASGEFAYMRVD